jgi:hypothetical protein
MRTYFLIQFLLLILLTQHCVGQSVYPSKKTIHKLFKTSIKQESRKKVQVDNNAWTACNKDSSFFTSDTVVFNNSNSIKCCATVQWTFYRNDSFVQIMVQTCKEPSSATVTTVEDFYTIDLIDENKSVLMQTRNRAGKQIIFRVVSANTESRTIELVRIKKDNS